MSKSATGNIQKTTQNQGSSIDSQSQDWLRQIMAAAQGAGAAGPSPLTAGAAGYNSGMMGAGQTGMSALAGDPAATAKLMDPYQQQVIDANNKQWGVTNAQTQNQIDSRATAAGAFGGSRAAVTSGTALAANNLAQQGQTAGLLSNGYNNAMSQAATLAGYGNTGAQNNANLGMAGVGSPQQWLMQMLSQGYKGPMGQTSSGATTSGGLTTAGKFTIPGFG